MNVCVSVSGCLGENLDGGLPVYTRAHAGLWICVRVWDMPSVSVCPQVYAISTGCGLTKL